MGFRPRGCKHIKLGASFLGLTGTGSFFDDWREKKIIETNAVIRAADKLMTTQRGLHESLGLHQPRLLPSFDAGSCELLRRDLIAPWACLPWHLLLSHGRAPGVS